MQTAFIALRNYPAVYLSIPKSACTTFKNAIYWADYGRFYENPLDIHDVEREVLMFYDRHRDVFDQRFQDSYFFTFVRHPLRRAFSLYMEKIDQTTPRAFDWVHKILMEQYRAPLEDKSLEATRRGFELFLRFARDTRDGRIKFRFDHHWAPQYRPLSAAQTVRTLDFIGRLENFEEDMSFIRTRVGLPETFAAKRFNEGPKPRFSYDQLITEETREVAADLYRPDLLNFGYTI